MLSFGPISRHYDVLMEGVPYDMWAGYFQLLLTQIDAEPEKVLDVCCGTGTVAELLAYSGYEMAGVDLSEGMIEEARRKAEGRGLDIDYFVADITTMNLGRKFDAACSFFDSLNYITTLEGLRAGIAKVGEHLEEGGAFIFDVNTEYAFTEHMFDQHDKRASAKINYEWKGKYDRAKKIIEVNMRFWRDGETFSEVHVQRAHSDAEILEALRDGGFGWVRVYDSYTLNEPDPKSDRVHYVAVKS